MNQIVEQPLESQIIALATVIIKGKEGITVKTRARGDMAVMSEGKKLDARKMKVNARDTVIRARDKASMTEDKMSNARRTKVLDHSVCQKVVLTHSITIAMVPQDEMIAVRAVILGMVELCNNKVTKDSFNCRSKPEVNHFAAARTREIELSNRLTLDKACYKSFKVK